MASSNNREEESDVRKKFDNVCRELNMDEETAEEAWRSYEKIKTNYSLEVCYRVGSCSVEFERFALVFLRILLIAVWLEVLDYLMQGYFISGEEYPLAGLFFICSL